MLAGVGENGSIDRSDSAQTFVTGTNPTNYIMYSGKLWRAVSIDPSDNSVKLITQDTVATMAYNTSDNSTFADSSIDTWLNDTTTGFLSTLEEPTKYLKTDSIWDNTATTTDMRSLSRPAGTVTFTRPVGLLSTYEVQQSYVGTVYEEGYIQNQTDWWTMTPYNSIQVWVIHTSYPLNASATTEQGVRPAINLKSEVVIVSGSGTQQDPYVIAI